MVGAPSPDGKFLTCVDSGSGDLAIRDLASGVLRRLTRKPAGSREFAYFSAVSPDSRRVAYAWRNDEGFYELRVIAVDDGRARVLYRNPEAGFVQPSAWSPDGRQILTLFFRKDNISQIALVSAEDGRVRVLRSLNWVYPKKMDFSPDGRFIVYDSFARGAAGPRDIYLLALDGSQERALVTHASDDLFPLWSPDGTTVLFASDRLGTLDLWSVAVRNGRAAGDPALVRRGLGRLLPLGITRDGAYYYALRADTSEARIQPLDAGEAVRITGALTAPVWSRDGSMAWLVPAGAENYGTDARILRVRGPAGRERDLAPKLAHMEAIRWSPDGKDLLVSGSDGKGRAGVFLVDAATGGVRPVVSDSGAGFRGYEAAWLEDGRIVYANRGLRSRDLRSGAETELTAGGEVHHLAAKGDLIAYSDGPEIVVIRRNGTQALRMRAGEVAGLDWLGADLLISGAGGLQLLNPRTAQLRRLTMPGYSGGAAGAHPDGSRVAYVQGGTANEVWVARGIVPLRSTR